MTLYRIDAQVGDAWMPVFKNPVPEGSVDGVMEKYELAYPNLALRIVPVRVKPPRQKTRR